MRDDAIFRLYSMTKPVTAVALLMLLEQGQIALDDAVAKYIPGFAGLTLADGTVVGGAMTVRDLLRHTAGLTYGFHNRTPIDAAYRELRIAEMDTARRPARHDRAAAKACRWNMRRARNGSIRWRSMWLGCLVQVISGQGFADFVRDNILRAAADDRHRFRRAARKSRPLRRLLPADAQRAGAVRPPIPTRNISIRPSWNPAAAGWPARRPIICALPACC